MQADWDLPGFSAWLGGRAAGQCRQLGAVCCGEQAVQLADVLDAHCMRLFGHSSKECTAVTAPASILARLIGYQRARKLIDVVGAPDLSKQVPLLRTRIKRVENHISALGAIETAQVSAIRICDHGTIAPT